jgi:hypothetical protein
VRTIWRKGTEREQRASVPPTLPTASITTNSQAFRETADREPAPRERARWYSKICERPDVREARSSDTRPAKWEHAWFARQRRMRARTLLCRRDLGRRGKDVESATHLAKSCLYSDL